ncbi:MAG TPA: winged helix-turn-helix domain-containing protein [Terriglobales bacterium]|nr:winged helix-turn-helix domain-containing protein [Terriglobales bacterium]
MSSPSQIVYKFASFRLLPDDKQLLLNDTPVPLAPKAFDTLCLLVENHGRLVEKTEFLARVWDGSFVEEVVLAHAISQLRKALHIGAEEADLIETVPKRGYRFRARVEVHPAEAREAPSPMTLAVLPFENLSSDPEREYLANGITEEAIATLGQIDPERLCVIGRTSAMTYKGTTKSLAEIGRDLGANFLIEGSIRSEGSRLRITARLVRARDQIQIWSYSHDSEPENLIDFQHDLGVAIAQQVRLQLSPERISGLTRRQTQHGEAYDVYLRGRYFWNQLSPLTTRRALQFYERATELDPNYALAWCGLADAYSTSPINGDANPLEVGRRARDAAERAVSVGSHLAEVHASMAFVKFWLDWDWPEAEREFRRAIALDPNYALAHRTLGIVLSHSNRHREAVAAARRARELDPLDFVNQALSAQIAFNARAFEAAVEFGRRATLLDPEFWVSYIQLAQAYEQLGEHDAAFEALQKAGQFSSGNSKSIAMRGYLFAKVGRTGEAREVLRTLEAVSRERYVPPYATALVHAGLGEADAALEWLERAFEARDVHLVFLPVDPKWNALRNSARFSALVGQAGFSGGSS